jgi:hypothetical protein
MRSARKRYFRIDKKLHETRAVPKLNRPPFLYFKASLVLTKLHAPKSGLKSQLKSMFSVALISIITNSVLKPVNITEAKLLNFFTLFKNNYFWSKCLFYQNAMYMGVHRHEFEKYTNQSHISTTIITKVYTNTIHNILSLNKRTLLTFPESDYKTDYDTIQRSSPELELEFALKLGQPIEKSTILTNHFISSQFFRETVTLKTYKTFSRAVISLTRLGEAGRHRASTLNLGVNATNSLHNGIKTSNLFTNFQTTNALKVDPSVLMSLQFNHNIKLSL